MNAEPKKAAEQPRPSLRKALKGAPQRLWRLIYHNWPWKLLALFLALCLWAGLITQDPTLTRERVFTDVTVSVVGADTLRRNSGLIVLSGLEDENLTARLRVDVPQREYNTVTLTVEIEPVMVSRTFESVKLFSRGATGDVSVSLSLKTLGIVLRGPQLIMDGLRAASVVAYVDVSGLEPGSYELPVELHVEDTDMTGMTFTATPSTVLVTVK